MARDWRVSEPPKKGWVFSVSVLIYLQEGSCSFHQNLKGIHDSKMLWRMLLLEE